MSKRLLAMLAGVAALAMLVAGCGSSDEESLTKAEFIKQGDAICAKRTKQIGTDYRAAQKKAGGEEISQDALKDALLSNFQGEVDELRELGAPSGDEAQIEKMLDTMEAGVKEAEATKKDSALFSSGNQLVEGKEMSEKYGLKGCASLF